MNVGAVSGWGVIFFGVLGAIGQWHQWKMIRSSKSIQSVSVLWSATFIVMFAAYVVEGMAIQSFVMQIQGGIRVIMYLLIFTGIIQYNNNTCAYRDAVIMNILVCLIMIMSLQQAFGLSDQVRDGIFQLLGLCGVVTTCHQPYMIWSNKSRGSVSLKMIVIYLASTIFWIVYALAIHNNPLFLISIAFCVIYSVTIALWFKYPCLVEQNVDFVLLKQLLLGQLIRLEFYINGDENRTSAREIDRVKSIQFSPISKNAIQIQFFSTDKKYDFFLVDISAGIMRGLSVGDLGDSIVIKIIKKPSPANAKTVSGYV